MYKFFFKKSFVPVLELLTAFTVSAGVAFATGTYTYQNYSDSKEYNIYVQLFEKYGDKGGGKMDLINYALRGEGETKGSVSTHQNSSFCFDATDAGNGWTLYEYDGFDASALTEGVNYIRISFSEKFPADHFYFIDGIVVC